MMKQWLLYGAAAGALHANPALAQNLGRWTGVIPFPNIPVSAAVLPNGQLLTWSSNQPDGQEGDIRKDASQTYTSVYNPATGAFTPVAENSTLAPLQTPCNYHSVALLLPDGRVFSGGGGLCGTGCPANHQDGAIFSPPYLFNADGVTPAARPVIEVTGSVPPATALSGPFNAALSIPLGATFAVSASGPIKSFELIRLSAMTHTINTDQRRVPLTIAGVAGNNYAATMPSDSGNRSSRLLDVFCPGCERHAQRRQDRPDPVARPEPKQNPSSAPTADEVAYRDDLA